MEVVSGKYVNFVGHVDLEGPDAWRRDGLFEQLGHFVDPAIRRGIQFQIIDKTPFIDFGAGAARAARRGRNAGFAVQGLGQYARQGRFTNAPGSGEQPCVVQPLGRQRVCQGTDNVILANKGVKRTWPPLTRQYQISHAQMISPKGDERVNERGEPDFGTGSARLWLLRSRPDQIYRRTMRRGPPATSLTGVATGVATARIQPARFQQSTQTSARGKDRAAGKST